MIKEYSMRFNQNLLADLDWNFILGELESEEKEDLHYSQDLEEQTSGVLQRPRHNNCHPRRDQEICAGNLNCLLVF
jgi:hypothetical protein